jgi:molybdate transport system regulatory protein
MQPGARNKIVGTVASVKKGDIMSLIKVNVALTAQMSSVITTESAEELGLKEGDQVELIIKAIHVLPAKID